MTDETPELRRKRLLFRAQHMGSNENDILIGGFAVDHVNELPEDEIGQFEALIRESDQDIYNWVTGREPVPEAFDTPLMRKLMAYRPPFARD